LYIIIKKKKGNYIKIKGHKTWPS